MKYVILLALLLSSCTSKLDKTDEDLKQLKENIEANKKQLRVLDCHTGIYFAVEHFHEQLYQKVTKEQFEAAWKACEDMIK